MSAICWSSSPPAGHRLLELGIVFVLCRASASGLPGFIFARVLDPEREVRGSIRVSFRRRLWRANRSASGSGRQLPWTIGLPPMTWQPMQAADEYICCPRAALPVSPAVNLSPAGIGALRLCVVELRLILRECVSAGPARCAASRMAPEWRSAGAGASPPRHRTVSAQPRRYRRH